MFGGEAMTLLIGEDVNLVDKSPGNSNMLHIFNNNTYTDFRTANKHVLIPSYVIQVI